VRRAPLVCLVAVVASLVLPPASSARRRHRRDAGAAARSDFDYYVLSLSWSPQHCAERTGPPNDRQCGVTRHYAFVVHGLWPQYERGGFPASCPTDARLERSVVEGMLDVMPSDALVEHEWAKHGACTGLPAATYFELARRSFGSVAIPARYVHPSDAFRVSATDVREDFRAANPGLGERGLAVLCNGNYLTEVRVCVAKDGVGRRDCGRDVADRCRGTVTVRPVR